MDKDITLEQEFDLVFKAHYSLVKNFALMLLKSGQDADDIAQDVFTRLWAKPQIWQDNPGIDKYIYAMTKHAIFDFLKHKRIPLILPVPITKKTDSKLSVLLCWHYLSFRPVSRQVFSAEASLTSVFGMGTGGPSP